MPSPPRSVAVPRPPPPPSSVMRSARTSIRACMVRNGLVIALLAAELLVAIARTPIPLGEKRVAVPAPGRLAALQTAFDEDLLPFRQIFLQRLSLLSPEIDVVPFGPFLSLARLVVPDFRRGDAELRDRGPARSKSQLGVPAQIADENHLVHATHIRHAFGTRNVEPGTWNEEFRMWNQSSEGFAISSFVHSNSRYFAIEFRASSSPRPVFGSLASRAWPRSCRGISS